MLIVVIIVLILVFGAGGGYYGHSRWGGPRKHRHRLGTILLIVLVCWLLGVFPLDRTHRLLTRPNAVSRSASALRPLS